jgi:hypothetical protein
MAFAECTQNNEASINNVCFPDEALFHLDGVVNKQYVQAILDIRESTYDSRESASCTENYIVDRHLKSWTARANFL